MRPRVVSVVLVATSLLAISCTRGQPTPPPVAQSTAGEAKVAPQFDLVAEIVFTFMGSFYGVMGYFLGSGSALIHQVTGTSNYAITVRKHTPPPVFVGEWYVHGGQMVIESGGQGRISYSSPCGPDNTQRCRDTTRFRYETSPGGQELSATVTETQFLSESGVDLARMGEYYTAYSVGDTFELRSAAPHLLKTIRQSGGPSGNPYWCQSGVSKTDGHNCGA